MNTTAVLTLGATLLVALCIAAVAHAECSHSSIGLPDELHCQPPPRDPGLDRLMSGAYCTECAATECAQVELAAAEGLMDAQLRQAASVLRLGGEDNRMLESLYAAQTAWERYRDSQCELMTVYEDASEHAALRERCRIEFTVERILDLAEMQEKLEASSPRLVQVY